jgi:hypothetical protein
LLAVWLEIDNSLAGGSDKGYARHNIPNKKHGGDPLARTNFKFTKRQKELDRKKKQEEKRQSKLDKRVAPTETAADQLQPPAEDESPTPVS